MDTLDLNCKYIICKHLGKYLANCLLVNSQWKEFFHDNFDLHKPKQSIEQLICLLHSKLKLGVHYDMSNTLYIYRHNLNKMSKYEMTFLQHKFTLKLAIDKPSINYIPVTVQRVIQSDLDFLKLTLNI